MPGSSLCATAPLADSYDEPYVVPPSFEQHCWFVRSRDGLVLDNVLVAVRFRGPLDASALEQTLNAIVARHEIMRTAIRTVEREAMQVVFPTLRLPVPVLDLSHLSQRDQEAAVTRIAGEERRLPIDLTRAPMARCMLLRLEADDHVLFLIAAHATWDAWSTGVFLRELILIYAATLRRQPSPLPELHFHFADFAFSMARGSDHRTQAYWEDRLADLRSPSAPRLLHPTSSQSYQLRDHHLDTLTSEIVHGLQHLAREERSTLHIVFLGIFAALLARATGNELLTIAVVDANRRHPQSHAAIGCFVNYVFIRLNITQRSLRDVLTHTREVVLEAYANSTYFGNITSLRKAIAESYEFGYNSPFDYMFNFIPVTELNQVSSHGIDLEELQIAPWSPPHRHEGYPSDYLWHRARLILSLQVQASDCVDGQFLHSTDLMQPERIEQFGLSFTRLATLAALRADVLLDDLSIETRQDEPSNR